MKLKWKPSKKEKAYLKWKEELEKWHEENYEPDWYQEENGQWVSVESPDPDTSELDWLAFMDAKKGVKVEREPLKMVYSESMPALHRKLIKSKCIDVSLQVFESHFKAKAQPCPIVFKKNESWLAALKDYLSNDKLWQQLYFHFIPRKGEVFSTQKMAEALAKGRNKNL